jgi:hypothetical protein
MVGGGIAFLTFGFKKKDCVLTPALTTQFQSYSSIGLYKAKTPLSFDTERGPM